MNSREASAPFFTETPSVGNLFRTIGDVIREWIRIRIHAYRYKRLDFRRLRDEEIPDDLRKAIDADRNAPDGDFENL